MMRRCGVLWCVFLFALAANAGAQSVNEAWKKLDEAMTREIDSPPKEDKHGERMDGHQRSVQAQLRGVFESGVFNEPPEYLLGGVAEAFRSDEVTRAADNLRAALKKEREAKD